MARRICTTLVDPKGLVPLLTSCLNKSPGIRPIGIGETIHHVKGKAILHVIKHDIQDATGSMQLCAGQETGCKAAVHAMNCIFSKADAEGLLLVDETNAFNCLNRQSTLMNVQSLCPAFAKALTNIYGESADLVIDGETIKSCEGTTQGDPLAMGMYVLGILPLIKDLDNIFKQVWYADEAAACGKLFQLKKWWERIILLGLAYGFNANSSKTWLVVKPQHYSLATAIFSDTGVNITCEGKCYLGSAFGNKSFIDVYVQSEATQWVEEIDNLAKLATTHPQEAFAALTHGLTQRWSFVMRTIPSISNFFEPLKNVIKQRLIPAITISDIDRKIFALPTRLGGLSMWNQVRSQPPSLGDSKGPCHCPSHPRCPQN